MRSPVLAGPIAETLNQARDFFTRLVEAYQDRGLLSRSVPPEQASRVLAGLVPGFMVQHAVLGGVDADMFNDMFNDGVRALMPSPPAGNPDGKAPERLVGGEAAFPVYFPIAFSTAGEGVAR